MSDDPRAMLQSADSNKQKAPLEREEVILKDTVFFNPGDSLTDKSFFNGDAKDPMYKTIGFPVTSHFYQFNYISVSHDLVFDVTGANAALQNNLIRLFEQCSKIEFTKETKKIGEGFFINHLTENAWRVRSTSAAVAAGNVDVKDKFSSWYKLDNPILIGAGKQFYVELKAAKSMTLAAFSAAITPYYPAAANYLTTCGTRGYSISVSLRGQRWIEAQG